tara:strand:+ start:128 stop:985 length:858 start_codon:yes stop_codon:yes gene_type:complete
MTGFGNASLDSEFGKISLDIKSLNSKNLDLNYSLNPIFRNIEGDIRSILTNTLKRGKIDFKINFKISEKNFNSNLNHDVIKSYIKDLKKITPETLIDSSELLKIAITLPNSIETNRPDLNQNLLDTIKELVKNAVKELIDFRIQEGISMEKDLLSNLDLIKNKMIQIEQLIPDRMISIRKRLKKSLDNIKVEIDLNRFEQELIYYLEKFDINEEIVRLKNHLIYFKKTINESQIEKGKKLIFISQEIGREINTIGSKSNNLPIQQAVVEMKNELEKIKEQLLNIL